MQFLSRKTYLIFLLCSLYAIPCISQDTSWTIVKTDRVFSVAMPRNFIKTDTSYSISGGRVRMIRLTLWNGEVTVKILKAPASEMSDKEIVFSRLENDLKNQGRDLGFTPIFLDTVISHLKGLQGLLYNEDEVKKRGYFFIAEDKLYSIFYSKNETTGADHYKDFKRLLGSVNFSTPEATDTSAVPAAVTEYIPEAYEKDWKGEIIFCVVLVVMIAGLMLYIKYKA